MRPDGNRFCLFSIQFSLNSNEIIGGSNDNHIYIYDLEKKVRTHRVRAHVNDVNTVAFADKASNVFFSGSDDTLIKVWDRRLFGTGSPNGGCVGVLPGHLEGLTFIDSKMDGRYLISNGKDHCTKLWDIRIMRDVDEVHPRGNQIYGRRSQSHPGQRHKLDTSLMTYHGHEVMGTLIRCRFSPLSTGQKYIYTGSADGNVLVYDVLTGEVVKKYEGTDHVVRDVHWHPHQPEIMVPCWDGALTRWFWNPNPQEEPEDVEVEEEEEVDSEESL